MCKNYAVVGAVNNKNNMTCINRTKFSKNNVSTPIYVSHAHRKNHHFSGGDGPKSIKTKTTTKTFKKYYFYSVEIRTHMQYIPLVVVLKVYYP